MKLSLPALPRPTRPLAFGEFVALVAMMFSTIAFSIDAMLPALSVIGQELSPDEIGKAQLVVTAFVLGMGLGTLICGPLSDTLGRKPVILWGLLLYALAALVATVAQSIEVLLAARVVQGLGAAAPRVVALAMIRDQYRGRMMARVTSIVMTLFILVPAVAPAVGAGLMWLIDWRAIFGAFVVFGTIIVVWLTLRQPETLAPEDRRPLRARTLWAALREVLGHRSVLVYTAALTFAFGPMFAWLATVPLLFEDAYGRGASFPFWFAAVALIAGGSNILNARLVMRLGMKRLATAAFTVQVTASVVVLGVLQFDLPAPWDFALFFVYMAAMFFSLGLTFGNLNALALLPLGHIAGMGAAVIGSVYTSLSVLIAAPLSIAYDGTAVPLVTGTTLSIGCALGLMLYSRRLRDDEAG